MTFPSFGEYYLQPGTLSVGTQKSYLGWFCTITIFENYTFAPGNKLFLIRAASYQYLVFFFVTICTEDW